MLDARLSVSKLVTMLEARWSKLDDGNYKHETADTTVGSFTRIQDLASSSFPVTNQEHVFSL
jgi:hypothetical protein